MKIKYTVTEYKTHFVKYSLLLYPNAMNEENSTENIFNINANEFGIFKNIVKENNEPINDDRIILFWSVEISAIQEIIFKIK